MVGWSQYLATILLISSQASGYGHLVADRLPRVRGSKPVWPAAVFAPLKPFVHAEDHQFDRQNHRKKAAENPKST